ncbi:MAG: ion channel [Bacteroidota bacterium]|nr:ion channel [Bacteroidota bacterium]MDP4192074.1 ion channel [Bacteroidota bacterium]MDP4195648.1 ion channel [Bacteroidota bacterium]
MQIRSDDPGFGEKYFSQTQRLINKDGSFNIIKKGAGFTPRDIYQYLINISWPKFFLIILAFYVALNFVFAMLYFIVGADHINGINSRSFINTYSDLFFFSVQTFTTVGYGGMIPKDLITNIIAAMETLTGLLGFALATGLLYGRFSRPSARIIYSKMALISPFKDKNSFQFRIANQRRNTLMEMEAKVMVAFIERTDGQSVKRYYDMKLERSYIYFFPLSWTLVHPIDNESPLSGKGPNELRALEAEILILIKGFDDTFSQVVHSRFSYRYDEIIWGAKFKKTFFIDDNGDFVIDLKNIHDYEKESFQYELL